jgi:hypothetical protein
MTEFAGLVLFGTVIAIVICAVFGVVYCGYTIICLARRPAPLAENENPV